MAKQTDVGNDPIRVCVVAADATRARVFTLEDLQTPEGVPTLLERMTLVDPARRSRPSELFSDTRPGIDRAPSGRAFAFDDHRDDAMRRMDRAFAAEIADAIALVTRAHGSTKLILAASPRMLGFMRELAPVGGGELELREIDRDLAHFTGPQLHDYLAKRGLLPARERLGATAMP